MQLTIHEVSKLLNLPVGTLERWIRQGKIPVYSFEGEYLFLEKDLKKWARSHNIVFASESNDCTSEGQSQKCSLALSIKKGGVLHGIEGDDVSSVLKALVEAAPLDPSIDRSELFARLIEREEMSSTGIGRGVAIPHPRTPLKGTPPTPSITTCFLKKPIDYGAIDGLPVFVLFLMISPSPKVHLNLIAKLSYLLRERTFIDFLRARPSASELCSRISELEARMGTNPHPHRPNNAY